VQFLFCTSRKGIGRAPVSAKRRRKSQSKDLSIQ
jgi:hypothetical protein